jgi:hypothetical protein
MFTLAGLLAARRGWFTVAGLSFGIAMLIRPMACFALAGWGIAQWFAVRKVGRICQVGAVAATAVVCGLIWVHHWRGDAMAGMRYYAMSPNAYGGQLLTWPFHALLTAPSQRHATAGRVVYIWAHVVLVLAACALSLVSHLRNSPGRKAGDWRDLITISWLWSNTLFVLCIGSVWGFECFHRFLIPALPAMFWAIRGLLPKRAVAWTVLATASVWIAIATVLHDLPAH